MGLLTLTQIPYHHVLANEFALNLKYRIGLVAAATILPKFLKFWTPPHDLAWFSNRLDPSNFGHV